MEMMRELLHSDGFAVDLYRTYVWYQREAGERIARRYLTAVSRTLESLRLHPGQGRLRCFQSPLLREIRSWRVDAPFGAHLIFYRYSDDTLWAERLLHGSRDLQARLLEAPETDS
ncbi:type II toxin-antitoxin system RelE/ParE family toxin [Opitutaceae bacterium TAV4]|nr:type II toxin-antitoxin system RelE/ParE family toxin [Opitutaceae bacterium TAV4]RRK00003.1 type II toxin-antitoxin system RelE/ParE family toxin [Opitutaceae bacterium TAV3]